MLSGWKESHVECFCCREVAQVEKEAQMDSTGSAEGQGSLQGQAEGGQAQQRQASPDNASPLQPPQGFQAYVPPQLPAVGQQQL